MPGPAPVAGSVMTMGWLGIAWIGSKAKTETAILPAVDYEITVLTTVEQNVLILSWRKIQRPTSMAAKGTLKKKLIHIFDYPSFF